MSLFKTLQTVVNHEISINYRFSTEAIDTLKSRQWLSSEQRNALNAVCNKTATKNQCATVINAMRRDAQLCKCEGKLFSAIAK